MDFKIAWWNCYLSAPASSAVPRAITSEFVAVILNMLDSGVDIFCLCEVNEKNCVELQRYITAAAQINSRYEPYLVCSLFSREGNKIDDYGVIYNKEKLSPTSIAVDLNARSDVTGKHLKVGKRISFVLEGEFEICVILCHWQSLRTYAEDSHVRTEVALALRGYVRDIYDESPEALIVICGDFNDEPFSRSIQMVLKASRDISYVKARSDALFNPFWRLVGMTDLVKGIHLPAGTCSSSDAQYMTNWRTFDQIILSSGFLKDGWSFVGSGVEIMNALGTPGSLTKWADISDHYPITCNLKRVV